jgi:hypothetical protein
VISGLRIRDDTLTLHIDVVTPRPDSPRGDHRFTGASYDVVAIKAGGKYVLHSIGTNMT